MFCIFVKLLQEISSIESLVFDPSIQPPTLSLFTIRLSLACLIIAPCWYCTVIHACAFTPRRGKTWRRHVVLSGIGGSVTHWHDPGLWFRHVRVCSVSQCVIAQLAILKTFYFIFISLFSKQFPKVSVGQKPTLFLKSIMIFLRGLI